MLVLTMQMLIVMGDGSRCQLLLLCFCFCCGKDECQCLFCADKSCVGGAIDSFVLVADSVSSVM